MKSSKWHDAVWVCMQLQQAGYQAVIAGGAVRDAWLGLSPSEFDVATAAEPDQIEALFSKTIAVGKNFGVIVVLTMSGPIEVATFRADGRYSDGRHPDSIKFADLQTDAERRDFTMNAMFYDPHAHVIIDVVAGLTDLENKVIRAVGDPEKRFAEDALRVMRAVRFTAQLGFRLEDKTERAVGLSAPSLMKVSRERISTEFDKLLIGREFKAGLSCFSQLGLAQVVFPEWHSALFPLTMSLDEFDLEERRLAFFWPLLQPDSMVGRNIANDTFERRLREYRYSREFILLLQWLRARLDIFDDGVSDNVVEILPIAEVDRRWARRELKRSSLDDRLIAQLLFFTDPRSLRSFRVLDRSQPTFKIAEVALKILSRRGLKLGVAPKLPLAGEVRSLRGSLEGAHLGASIQDLHRERLLRAYF